LLSFADEKFLEDKEYVNVLREYHKIPNTGHRLFVIHPGIVNALTIKFLIQVTDYL
jgi:pimeloyl-ACP methyl ester carboxylesterase